MKTRNLITVLLLGTCVLTAQAAVPTSVILGVMTTNHNIQRAETTATIVNSTTSNMMSTQNSVVVECILQREGERNSRPVPSLKETIKADSCKNKKEDLEILNSSHYEFGKVKGIFTVIRTDHIMIELAEVH